LLLETQNSKLFSIFGISTTLARFCKAGGVSTSLTAVAERSRSPKCRSAAVAEDPRFSAFRFNSRAFKGTAIEKNSELETIPHFRHFGG
jgi:hypothetical protein